MGQSRYTSRCADIYIFLSYLQDDLSCPELIYSLREVTNDHSAFSTMLCSATGMCDALLICGSLLMVACLSYARHTRQHSFMEFSLWTINVLVTEILLVRRVIPSVNRGSRESALGARLTVWDPHLVDDAHTRA